MATRLVILAVFSIVWMIGPPRAAAQRFASGGNTNVVLNQPGIGDPYAIANPQGGGGLIPGFPGVGAPLSERFWLRTEYLLWWTDRMDAPPLVTGSPAGTPGSEAGVLGLPDTNVLYGGGEINEQTANGFRLNSGFWLTRQRVFAIEGEYFRFADQEGSFSASGDGAPIVARPFFDVTTGAQNSQLISFPGLVAGRVDVSASSQLDSVLINGRVALLPNNSAWPTCDEPDRVDWLIGYRHLRLRDRLAISDLQTELDVTPAGTIASSESFATENRFNALQLGVAHRANFRRAWLESLLRVAVGSNSQRVQIDGATTLTEPSTSSTFSGGMLALDSNIGSYRRDRKSVV